MAMNDEVNTEDGAMVPVKNEGSMVQVIDIDRTVSDKDLPLKTATTANNNESYVPTEDELLFKQMQLEHRAVDEGQGRYWDRLKQTEKKSPAYVSGVGKLQDESLRGVSAILKSALDKQKTTSRKPTYHDYVVDINVDILAWIAVSTILESYVAQWDRQRYMKHCGVRVQVEYNLHRIQDKLKQDLGHTEGGKAYKAWEKETVSEFKQPHKREVSLLGKGSGRLGVEPVKLNDKALMEIGCFLWMAVTDGSEIFQEKTIDVWHKGKKRQHIKADLTDKGLKIFQDYRNISSTLHPNIGPMVYQPNDWSDASKPFLTDDLNAVTNIVTNVQPEQLAKLNANYRDGSAKIFYDGLNHTNQSTMLRIDSEMVEFVAECIDNKLDINGLPRMTVPQIPELPEDFASLNKDDKALHRDGINLAEEEETVVNRNIVQWGIDYSMATEWSAYEKIYLAWKVDQRGRFVCTTMMNPQRGDHIRSFFSFARKRPVTEAGYQQLKIHIANMYAEGPLWGGAKKLDKVGFKTRMQWVEGRKERLLEIAKEPLKYLSDWQGAGEPMQFIKAIKVLLLVHEEGVDVESDIICYADAASSGTQIFSAMSKHRGQGELCGLTPSSEPANIYQKGAVEATKVTEAHLIGDDEEKARFAQMFKDIGAPNVATSKRNFMTAGYDSPVAGMADQIYEDIIKPRAVKLLHGEISEDNFPFPKDKRGQRKASRYLAAINNSKIHEILGCAMETLAFLKDTVAIVAALHRPQYWQSQSGFVAVNQYFKMFEREIKLTRLNVKTGIKRNRSQVRYAELDTQRIDMRESRKSIGANFIHSRDADHVHHILYSCKHRGIDDIVHIHDCFGTHPAQMDNLHEIIRATFVNLYENKDVLRQFLNEMLDQWEDEFVEQNEDPELDIAATRQQLYARLNSLIPEVGDLELAEVKHSKYFVH